MNELGIALDFTKGLQLLTRFHALNESFPKATLNSTLQSLQEHKQSREHIKAQSKYKALYKAHAKWDWGGEKRMQASQDSFCFRRIFPEVNRASYIIYYRNKPNAN